MVKRALCTGRSALRKNVYAGKCLNQCLTGQGAVFSADRQITPLQLILKAFSLSARSQRTVPQPALRQLAPFTAGSMPSGALSHWRGLP
jgi:hypothetical protein